MNGLIIKKEWLDKIFAGQKDWEIRSSKTNIRGTIFLIQSGSKKIFGQCDIIDCKQLSIQDFQSNQKHHCISKLEKLPYKKTFAWVITNVKKFEKPISYNHPLGAVIWV